MQHRSAGAVPDHITKHHQLLRYLAARPIWLLGVVLGAVAFAAHAAALHLGAIAFVQPIVAAGVVFAVPVRDWMDRKRPSLVEIRAVTVAVVGLALLLVFTDADPTVHRLEGWLVVGYDAVVLAVVLALGRLSSRFTDGRWQAVSLAAGAGVLFGMVAGMVKVTFATIQDDGLVSPFLVAELAFLAFCGLVGMLYNQRSYRTAALSMSMPVVNVVNVLSAVVFGWAVLGAPPSGSPATVAVQMLGLAVMAVGLRLVARAQDPVVAHPSDEGVVPAEVGEPTGEHGTVS